MTMRSASTLLLLTALAGCTVGPDYKGPPAVASDAVARGSFVRAKDATLVPTPGLSRWWEGLGDATLTALIDDALAHSPTIDAAQAKIREARAQVRSKRAAELPSVSATGTYLHAELPGTSIEAEGGGAPAGGGQDPEASGSSSSSLDFYNIGANASWELDIFGGGRRAIEGARATLGQRFADLADAQVSLSAQVAQAYVNLRDVQERARLNAASSQLQDRSLGLTRQRRAAGTVSELDVARLENQLQSTKAEAIPLDAQIDEYKDQLAILTGRSPGALDATLDPPAPVPLPPAQVAIGDPATLIARRPDVRSAERALAAGNAQIGVDKAKLFPSIKFMGLLGLGGTDPGDVLDPDKLTTILAPMLSWSFLDFGRGEAAVEVSEAKRDQAAAQYRQKVLEALQDAETNLSRFGGARRQLARLADAERAAARSAQLNAQRVKAGTSSLIDQLDIERQRRSAEIAVAQAKAQLTIDYIAIQKSLGLGWSEPPPPEPSKPR